VNDYDKVIAFRRWSNGGPGDETMVILCFSEGMKPDYRMGFPMAGVWKLRFNRDAKFYDKQLDGEQWLSFPSAATGLSDRLGPKTAGTPLGRVTGTSESRSGIRSEPRLGGRINAPNRFR
jgi:1,4-alpha-glucan branching enzyme